MDPPSGLTGSGGSGGAATAGAPNARNAARAANTINKRHWFLLFIACLLAYRCTIPTIRRKAPPGNEDELEPCDSPILGRFVPLLAPSEMKIKCHKRLDNTYCRATLRACQGGKGTLLIRSRYRAGPGGGDNMKIRTNTCTCVQCNTCPGAARPTEGARRGQVPGVSGRSASHSRSNKATGPPPVGSGPVIGSGTGIRTSIL